MCRWKNTRVGGSLVVPGALAFTLVRPQLTAALSLSTQAGNSLRVNLLGNRLSGPGVVVEGQFGAGGNIAVGEKGDVIEVFVILVLGRHRHVLAIGITRMVHEAGSRTKFAAIDDVHLFFIEVFIIFVPIQGKEVGLGVFAVR